MLTPEQIAALRDAAGQVTDPINDFLLDDIARRIAGAGQLTSTAAYQVYRAQQLGLSRRVIEKRLRELLGVNRRMLRELLTQAAEVGYSFDIRNFPGRAVPFGKNESLQQLVSAAVQLAQEDFSNLTQTLGMVDPFGNALPLQDAYRKSMDYAFEQVFTGAADYNMAIRTATKNLADRGVRVIDYESGVHTSLEAAARRNIMGGLGLMQEQITRESHDELGADGWEISAHANSAPDHEPIQGKQYGDKAYEALNNSLRRRIGTLNCGHAAFPIILGVSAPQYSDEELQKFREDNERGVIYEGRHFTGYEATQMQRKIERAMRTQKNRILVDEAAGDEEKLLTDQIRLGRLNEEYRRFSRAAGLPTQQERAQVAGFGRGQAARASAGAEQYYQNWSKGIGINNSIESLAKYYDVKYTNSPRYELLKKYAASVGSGRLSPLSGFDLYEEYHGRIQSGLVGTSVNGTTITGHSQHFLERVFGCMLDPKTGHPRSGTALEDVFDCLQAPVSIQPVRVDQNRERSFVVVGHRAKVSIDPDTGMLIQTNPWRC